jgi:hypothetical protein
MTIFVDNYKVNKNLGKSMNTTQSIMKKNQRKLGFFDKNFKYIPTTIQFGEETFKGITYLKAITYEELPFIKINLLSANYDEMNQAFDVTQNVESNGTMLTAGIPNSITSGFAEVGVTR